MTGKDTSVWQISRSLSVNNMGSPVCVCMCVCVHVCVCVCVCLCLCEASIRVPTIMDSSVSSHCSINN